jgi:uncharacterized cupin superfamily protein
MSHVDLDQYPVVPTSFARMQPLNEALAISAFGLNAVVLDPGDGSDTAHDESDDLQQEVYVVLRGRARIRVGDEEVEATPGTIVAAPDPSVVRSYEALEPGTRLLCIGAQTPDEPPPYGAWIEQDRTS